MENKINQSEVDQIMKTEGEVRGAVFKTDRKFILDKKGEEGIKEVEKELEEMGHPFKYNEAEDMEFYSFGLRMLSLLAIKKALGFSEEDIEEMGRSAPKASFLIKFFTKYFLSVGKTINKIEDVWKKHSTTGNVEVIEIDEEEGRSVFRFSSINFHPLYRKYLAGYLAGAISMVTGKKVEAKEINRSEEEKDFYEFEAVWEK